MNSTLTAKNSRKKKGRLKKWIVFLIILAILAAIVLPRMGVLKRENAAVYQEYTATLGTISNSLSFSGSLQAIDSAAYTAEAETTVRSLYVTEGQSVQEGDKLMRLANGQTIEAEFSGKVNKIYFEEDDEVSPGDTLIHVVDFNHLKVSVRVDEYDISDVHVGDVCRVTTTATEQTFESVVASIDYTSSSSGSVAYYAADVYVDVDDGVYPGMQVTVTVPQEEATNVVILKVDALTFDVNNNAYVLVRNASGELEKADVEIGVSNGNYIEIVRGLSEGDVVYAEQKNTITYPFADVLESRSDILRGEGGDEAPNMGGGR